MGKTNNDSFLSSLDKMLKDTKEKGSVTITLKRSIKPENGRYKPGTKQTRELIDVEKRRSLEDPARKYPVVIHAKSDDVKSSTEVDPTKAGQYENSLINVFRLYCFKSVLPASKKIKKPTAKDPNSKTSKKIEARKQLKKMRNIKKKEKLIAKRIALRTNPNKMEVEKNK